MSDSPPVNSQQASRTDPEPAPIRSMHDILSNWERRALLFYLQERDGAGSIHGAAAALVGWRDGVDPPAAGDRRVVEMQSALRHSHVPKMIEFGVLDHEPEPSGVRLAEGVTVAVAPPWRASDGAPVED